MKLKFMSKTKVKRKPVLSLPDLAAMTSETYSVILWNVSHDDKIKPVFSTVKTRPGGESKTYLYDRGELLAFAKSKGWL